MMMTTMMMTKVAKNNKPTAATSIKYLTHETSISQESTLLTCGEHAVPSHGSIKDRKEDLGFGRKREAGDTHTLMRVIVRGSGDGTQL